MGGVVLVMPQSCCRASSVINTSKLYACRKFTLVAAVAMEDDRCQLLWKKDDDVKK